MARPPRVALAGVSAVAGGADGWGDERAAVFSFAVERPGQAWPLHVFSVRYSAALSKHDRMVATGLEPLLELDFPRKPRLRNMRDDVDNVLERGEELASYYTAVLRAAGGDAPSRMVVGELLGMDGSVASSADGWAGGGGGAGPGAVDGVVSLACVDGATLMVQTEAGSVRRICSPGTDVGVAVARLSASRAVWGDCFRALMAVAAAEPSGPPTTEEPSPAAVAAQAAAALRDDAAQKAARAPEILEPRLRQ